MDLVALLPWWAGVALAVVSYVLLHDVASQTVVVTRPDPLGSMVTQALWKGLATFGQVALPLICLAAAAVSALRRLKRRSLFANVHQGNAADVVDQMPWREFEMLVGEALRHRGYRVLETGGSGPDGGVDLVLAKGGEKFLVQCKQWRAWRVGVEVVRSLYGVMAARGAAGGFVVTSGRFTRAAKAFAAGRSVELIDGAQLLGWIADVQASAAVSVAAGVADGKPMEVTCPRCAGPMVKKRAQRGPNPGSVFLGCIQYPSCRGTRPIESGR